MGLDNIKGFKHNTKGIIMEFTSTDIEILDKHIMQDDCFSKTYTIGEKTKVVMRTRTGDEFLECLKYVENIDSKIEYMFKLNLAMLAFSLKKIDNVDYDSGSFEVRLTILKKWQTPKIALLLKILEKFDKEVEDGRLKFENF